MYETEEELKELQLLLDKSMDNAGAHVRSIFKAEHRLSAIQLCNYLTGIRQSAFSTVNSKGEPRVSPVDSIFFHGRFYLSSDENSLKVKHLKRNPNVSLTQFEGAAPAIMAHGSCHLIRPGDPEFGRLDAEWIKTYGNSITQLSNSVVFICIDAKMLFAFSFRPL